MSVRAAVHIKKTGAKIREIGRLRGRSDDEDRLGTPIANGKAASIDRAGFDAQWTEALRVVFESARSSSSLHFDLHRERVFVVEHGI